MLSFGLILISVNASQAGRILFERLWPLSTGVSHLENEGLSGGILALVGEIETVRGTKIRESNRQVSRDFSFRTTVAD
jgi:hypothetical protein